MKKRLFLMVVATLMMMHATAQTNFRKITYPEALAAAKAEGKRIFIDFQTTWCGPCKMMAKNIFPLKAVGDYMNAKFVAIALDAEKEGKDLAKRFKVKAYPTFIIVGADDVEIGRTEGSHPSGDSFIAELDRISDPSLSNDKVRERYASGERNGKLVNAYAQLLREKAQTRSGYDQQKMAEAQKVIEDYYASLSEKDRLLPENIFLFDRTFTDSPYSDRGQFLVNNRAKFPADSQEQVQKDIDDIFAGYIFSALTGDFTLTPAELSRLRQDAKTLNLTYENTSYEPVFGFIQQWGDGSKPEAYLDYCKNNFSKLTETQGSSLLFGFTNLFGQKDDAIKKLAAQFIRQQLLTQPANNIMFLGRTIGMLENAFQKH